MQRIMKGEWIRGNHSFVISVIYISKEIRCYSNAKKDIREYHIKRILLDRDDYQYTPGHQYNHISHFPPKYYPQYRNTDCLVRIFIKDGKIKLKGIFTFEIVKNCKDVPLSVTYLSDSKIIVDMQKR